MADLCTFDSSLTTFDSVQRTMDATTCQGGGGGTTLRRRRRRKYGSAQSEIQVTTYEGIADQGTNEWELVRLIQANAELRVQLDQAHSAAFRAETNLSKMEILQRIRQNEARILDIEEQELAQILPFLLE